MAAKNLLPCLPSEVILFIFSHLEPADFSAVLCLNRAWKKKFAKFLEKKRISAQSLNIVDSIQPGRVHSFQLKFIKGDEKKNEPTQVLKEWKAPSDNQSISLRDIMNEIGWYQPVELKMKLSSITSYFLHKLPSWWLNKIEIFEVESNKSINVVSNMILRMPNLSVLDIKLDDTSSDFDEYQAIQNMNQIKIVRLHTLGLPSHQRKKSMLKFLTLKSLKSESKIEDILIEAPKHQDSFDQLFYFLENANFADRVYLEFSLIHGNFQDSQRFADWLKDNATEVRSLEDHFFTMALSFYYRGIKFFLYIRYISPIKQKRISSWFGCMK